MHDQTRTLDLAGLLELTHTTILQYARSAAVYFQVPPLALASSRALLEEVLTKIISSSILFPPYMHLRKEENDCDAQSSRQL